MLTVGVSPCLTKKLNPSSWKLKIQVSANKNSNLNLNYQDSQAAELFYAQDVRLPGKSQCCGTSHFQQHLKKICLLVGFFFLFEKRVTVWIPSCFFSPQMFITPCWGGIIPIQLVKHTYK